VLDRYPKVGEVHGGLNHMLEVVEIRSSGASSGSAPVIEHRSCTLLPDHRRAMVGSTRFGSASGARSTQHADGKRRASASNFSARRVCRAPGPVSVSRRASDPAAPACASRSSSAPEISGVDGCGRQLGDQDDGAGLYAPDCLTSIE